MPTDAQKLNVDRLEAAARERWGDEWTIQTQRFADGDSRSWAYHVCGHPDPEIDERERLFIGSDGEIYHDRVRVQYEQVVDVVERDEPPAEIASELRE